MAGIVVVLSLGAAGCASSGVAESTIVGAPAEVEADSARPAAPTTAPVAAPTAEAAPRPSPTPLDLGAAPAPSPTVPATAVAVTDSPPVEPTLPAPTATAGPTQPAAVATEIPTPQPPSSSQEVLIANGGEVYTLNCARCHAENGTGSERYGGLIGVGGRYSSQAMINELTNGHPVTFGFADKLSADEIASVVAYVKAAFP